MSDIARQTWVIADDRIGHANQALGVAEALEMPFEVFALRYNRLSCLPNLVLGASDRHVATYARRSRHGRISRSMRGAGRHPSRVR